MQQVAHRGAWLPHYPHSVWVTCLSLTAHCCCWFVSCTSMIQTTTPPHPKGALVEWHMLIVEVNLVQSTQWHVCDMAAGSTMEQFGHTSMTWHDQQQWSGRLWHWNHAQLVQKGPIITPPTVWTRKDGSTLSCCSRSSLTLPSECCNRN